MSQSLGESFWKGINNKNVTQKDWKKDQFLISENCEKLFEIQEELEKVKEERDELKINYGASVEEMHDLLRYIDKLEKKNEETEK